MQQEQALKNEHFKKIWEKVNWQSRNPQAASLEEALKFEKRHFDCAFIYNDISGYCGENCIDLREQINNYNAFANEHLQSLSFFEKKKFMKTLDSEAKILGRPITLEDILIMLSKKAYSISIPCISSTIIVTILNGGVVTEYFIDWQLGKPIEEQTPETWEQIANFNKKS